MTAMPNTFEILAGFLSRFGDEVEGRESSSRPPEVSVQLCRFARGQLPAVEQAGLIQQLNEHPDWVAALAAEAKALRDPDQTNR
jgi:hypothetical protein